MPRNDTRLGTNIPHRSDLLARELAVILDTMPDGLFTVDAAGRIELWNREMTRLTGHAARDIVGKPCTILECENCRGKDPGWVPECDLLGGEPVEQKECSVRHRDGRLIPVMKNARAIRDATGRIVGAVETLTDLSSIKRLKAEMARFEARESAEERLGRLVGKSHVMQEVYRRIRLAANSEATVLIQGETGTGKELVAEAIHNLGRRRDGPLIRINCSALPEGLLESELFGHVRGAFTGAVRDKPGRFELADGGTILLDEIGDISPLIQLKLLRVLQEHEIERVGDTRVRKVDVRVVAATHRDLRELVALERFREDLYYRLRIFVVSLPPLRARKEDIPLLVDTFIERFNRQTGKKIEGISAEVALCLMDYCWPGNVRELENAIEHAFVTCPGGRIGLFDLPVEIRMTELRRIECERRAPGPLLETRGRTAGVRPARPALTRENLLAVLRESNWNKAEAGRRLGVARTTVWRKMRQWGVPLEPPAAT
ncbi:MAG: PAS domain S-box protein [Kiritimatiellaeota bacterium]|nr:PAS domain S-box protein [Kiritimatiellota bacterium]